MVKYTGPRIKIIRRLGLLLPGLSRKSSKIRIKTPGQHGIILYPKGKRSSLSDDYKNCLLEKQKLRFNYGVTEKQLISYYNQARKSRGSTGTLLLELLEARLDCVLYRFGFAPTIPAARQLVNHGHILVNTKLVNIPSFICKSGDILEICKKQKVQNLISRNLELQQQKRKLIRRRMKRINLTRSRFPSLLPTHLKIDAKALRGKFICPVKRKNLLVRINELKVVEYYSR